MKASEGTKPAPFTNRARVVDNAAKEHELEIKPKKVPNATLLGPAFPMDFCMRSLVTKLGSLSLLGNQARKPKSHPKQTQGSVSRLLPLR